MENLERFLELRGVKPTAMRLLILRELTESACAMSLGDLENRLVTVDKSTIFRTLTLFLDKHLVHSVDDGSGQAKYAVCEEDCRCNEGCHSSLADHHAHFFCEVCQRTHCLRHIPIPEVELPDGFHLHTANYVLKGICPECRKRKPACQ